MWLITYVVHLLYLSIKFRFFGCKFYKIIKLLVAWGFKDIFSWGTHYIIKYLLSIFDNWYVKFRFGFLCEYMYNAITDT